MNPSPTSSSTDVFEALHELMHAFRNHMMAASQLETSELTFGEVRILMRLGRRSGLTQKDLVEHSRVDKAQMARMLTQLESQGWLLRTPSAQDRRVRCLQLSAQGQALFDRLKHRHERLASELLADMPSEAQAQLLALLSQARRSAKTATPAKPAPPVAG